MTQLSWVTKGFMGGFEWALFILKRAKLSFSKALRVIFESFWYELKLFGCVRSHFITILLSGVQWLDVMVCVVSAVFKAVICARGGRISVCVLVL